MGILKLFRRFPYAVALIAVLAAFLSTFILSPKWAIEKNPIGADGICGPFGEVLLYAPYEPRVAPDGDWFIFYARNILGYYAVAGGSQYGPYDVIVPLRPDPEGSSWGFVGMEGDRIFVVVDGEVRAEYVNEGAIFWPGIPSKCYCERLFYRDETTTLSNDGRRWAFKMFNDNGEYAIVNGTKLGPYHKIYFTGVSPSADNWGLVFAIRGEEYAIVNGETYGPFGRARDLHEKHPPLNAAVVFSESGGFWAVDRGRFRPRTSFIVNGEEYGSYDLAYRFRWSENGRLWAVMVVKDGKAYFLVNGIEYGPYDVRRKSGIPMVNVSAGGSAWGGCYTEGGSDFVIVNGRTYGPYEFTAEPYFSADGSNWGFKARKNGRAYKVINGVEWGPYEEVLSGLWFGGTSWAFWAKKHGAWYVVVDGAEWGPYSTGSLPETTEWSIRLSGPVWAVRNKTEEGFYAVINGEEYGPYDFASTYQSIMINSDGTAWVLPLSTGYRQPEYAVVNGVEYGPFYCCVTFADVDRVGFWALEGPFVNSYRLVKKTAP